MVAKARVYALALGAALVMASGGVPSDEAMAQSDDAVIQANEAAAESGEAAVQADDVTARDEAVQKPVPRPVAADRPAKADLDQSAVRAVPVTRPPRATRTSTRAIALPKILGSYR